MIFLLSYHVVNVQLKISSDEKYQTVTLNSSLKNASKVDTGAMVMDFLIILRASLETIVVGENDSMIARRVDVEGSMEFWCIIPNKLIAISYCLCFAQAHIIR
eukprot:TRINITY_DN1734_c1_g1_i1.p2 TRINITY_DN1734_c1_g1~~TRINITY_DN1734_c1_g1_i1.p2  ORF type:complete len:103 (-),score=10.78 TRINITY_DN1734_c1_g1_i1:13-321(-)